MYITQLISCLELQVLWVARGIISLHLLLCFQISQSVLLQFDTEFSSGQQLQWKTCINLQYPKRDHVFSSLRVMKIAYLFSYRRCRSYREARIKNDYTLTNCHLHRRLSPFTTFVSLRPPYVQVLFTDTVEPTAQRKWSRCICAAFMKNIREIFVQWALFL